MQWNANAHLARHILLLGLTLLVWFLPQYQPPSVWVIQALRSLSLIGVQVEAWVRQAASNESPRVAEEHAPTQKPEQNST